MSYRCDKCDAVVPPNTSAMKVILQTRKKDYPMRKKTRKAPRIVNGKMRTVWLDDPPGSGYEIVKEASLCVTCLGKFNEGELNQ